MALASPKQGTHSMAGYAAGLRPQKRDRIVRRVMIENERQRTIAESPRDGIAAHFCVLRLD